MDSLPKVWFFLCGLFHFAFHFLLVFQALKRVRKSSAYLCQEPQTCSVIASGGPLSPQDYPEVVSHDRLENINLPKIEPTARKCPELGTFNYSLLRSLDNKDLSYASGREDSENNIVLKKNEISKKYFLSRIPQGDFCKNFSTNLRFHRHAEHGFSNDRLLDTLSELSWDGDLEAGVSLIPETNKDIEKDMYVPVGRDVQLFPAAETDSVNALESCQRLVMQTPKMRRNDNMSLAEYNAASVLNNEQPNYKDPSTLKSELSHTNSPHRDTVVLDILSLKAPESDSETCFGVQERSNGNKEGPEHQIKRPTPHQAEVPSSLVTCVPLERCSDLSSAGSRSSLSTVDTDV